MRDPYVYEGTNVLINKLNIRDENELGRAESEFVIFAIEELKNESFVVNNIFDALKIHKYLLKIFMNGQVAQEPLMFTKANHYWMENLLIMSLLLISIKH